MHRLIVAALIFSANLMAQDAAKGKELFVKYSCYACHDFDGHGGAGARLVPMKMLLPVFTAYVRSPRAMPAYRENVMSNAELADVWAYIKTIPDSPPAKSIPLLVAATLWVAADDTKLTAAEARKLKNPIPSTKKSIDRGRTVYLQNCTGCHGTDGKAETAVIAEATDLTSPKLYKNGTSEGEIFRSIRDGAGDQMPPFKSQIEEEDSWNLVNFIRSLWPSGAPK